MARRKSSKKRPLSGEARRATRPAERRRPERSTKRDAASSTRSGPAAASVVTGPKTSPERTRTSSPLRRPATPRRRDPENAPSEPIARAGPSASEASPEQPLDLQPGPPPVLGGVPWGYGQTRITAMARDPHWIFAYWEFTDDALARARAAVHDQDAPCHLRVYDTTYRLFDGTNANWYVDLPVDRVTRDYYLHVNRPGSTVHVDVGVKSHQGGFATIARSGPVETPRDGVSTDTRVEWMTVEADGGAGPEYRHRFAPRSGTVASLG